MTAAVLIAADPPTVPAGDGEPPGQPYVSPDDLASIQPLWAQAVDEHLMPVVAEMWNDSAGQVHAEMVDATGVELPSVSSLAAEQYLQQASNTFAEVGNDLWETARAELLAGFQAGESIDQLAARLRGSAGLTAKKAVLVARTQVLDASNAGSIATVRASGLDMVKGWLATPDMRTRPTHVTAGQTYDEGGLVGMISLDDKFIVGGFECDRPHDPVLPPAERYSCRCTLAYGLPDEAVVQAREQAVPPAALPNTSGAPTQATLPPTPETGIPGVDYTDPALLESPHAIDIADAIESGMSPQEIIDIYVNDDGFSEDIATLLVNETVAALRAQGRMPLPKVTKREAARARQKVIDQAEPVAQFAAEVDNAAYARQVLPFDAETEKIFTQRIVQAEASGIPEEELAGMRAAVKARDLRRIREEAQRLQDKYQLEAIGKAGEQIPFDPATMQGLADGSAIPEGQLVTVVRQGHRLTVKGEVVQLDRALVERSAASAEIPLESGLTSQQVEAAAKREALAATGGEGVEVQSLNTGAVGDVRLIQTSAGKAVTKRLGVRFQMSKAEIRREIDAEVLGARVVDAVGGRAAATVPYGRDGVLMEFVEGRLGYEFEYGSKGALERVIESNEGRLMGLADYLGVNGDRNNGNFLVDAAGHIVGIDHGAMFSGEFRGSEVPFGAFDGFLIEPGTDATLVARIPVPPDDLAIIRRRLERLEPEFTQHGRAAWFARLMRRLGFLERRADPAAESILSS